MPDKEIVDQKIGNYGELKIGIVNGKLVQEFDLSGKVILEFLAAKAGGPVPEMVAQFIETTLGLT